VWVATDPLPTKEDLKDILTNIDVAHQALTKIMEDAGLTEPFSALLETYLIPYSTAGSNRGSERSE
jgi:uncharacterized protein YceK